jgi:tetratricopeptide (TPR) repeat protein
MLRTCHITVLALGLGLVGCEDPAYQTIADGNVAYDAGDYEGADALYKSAATTLPDLAQLHYNRGNVAYRLGLHDRAEELYSLALRTEDRILGSRVKYNLGRIKHAFALHNVLTYRTAMAPLREAIAFYQGSLLLDGDYADALYNLGLAQRLMEELVRKQTADEDRPRSRQSSYSPRMGQVFEETAPERAPGINDREVNVQMRPERGEALQGPRGNTDSETRGETDHGESTRELSPDEAAQMVQDIRGRARGAQGLHQQWSRLRMPEGEDGKDW